MKKNIVLVIRDGWGINEDARSNAVKEANTPNIDSYLKKYPNTILVPSGTAVGLPKGYQGSSEVGHLNMGAGRIVKQEISRINDSLKDKSFFNSANFQNALNNCIKNKSAMHIMGLVQDEGVHGHQDHLYQIIDYVKGKDIIEVIIHFFADGRDTPQKSSPVFLKMLRKKIDKYPHIRIGSIMGRYYSMDRSRNWALTDQAYDALVYAKGKKIDTVENAIKTAYSELNAPDGTEMVDEYIPPYIIEGYNGMKEGDSVVLFNYRQDRAIQISKAFVEKNYPGNRKKMENLVYCGFTRYYDSFSFNVLEPMTSGGGMENLLGEIVSGCGLRQLRIAETQKYRHVTSFFNGKKIDPYKGEDRIEIKGEFDPSTFADHPEMNAYDVADAVIKEINAQKYSLIILNFANCDMVGHTGNLKSTVKAVEVVDECVGKVVDTVLDNDGITLITADHGNAEEMFDYKLNVPKTAHTTNPVELIYAANDYKDMRFKAEGILADIAPTLLYLLGLEKPKQMTAENMIIT